MDSIYNIYCDESCHLEHDNEKAMVIGGVWCPRNKKDEIFRRIREIKAEHNLNRRLVDILPWTAYLVTYKARKEKLLEEYNAYIKSKERH